MWLPELIRVAFKHLVGGIIHSLIAVLEPLSFSTNKCSNRKSPVLLLLFICSMLAQQQLSCQQQKGSNSCILSPPVDSSYSQMIAEWPIAVLVLCSVTVVICTLAGLLVGNLPDFSEPLMVSPCRQYVIVNRRKIHRATSNVFFLPYKTSLCFLPSLQIEAARQDRRTLKQLEINGNVYQ